MHTSQPNAVEAICYEQEHQDKVLAVISNEFEKAFPGFVETEAGQLLSSSAFSQLQNSLGIKVTIDEKKAKKNRKENFINIIKKNIDAFEKNRQKYIDLMDPDILEEESEDLMAFKAKTLKNECPIIHNTLFTERDELKQYKIDFNSASPKRLFDVVVNLSKFSHEYAATYNEADYQAIMSYQDLKLSMLEEDDKYTAYGVIGGGIRSHMLYKLHPECFPNRSQWALWALWFLSNKEYFGCVMDSEFLMIDIKKCITQQNYFYPYDLFTYYAYKIYKMIDQKAKEMDAMIDPNYKYVIVDAFLNYVADQHNSEISVLRAQIPNGGYGYA